MMRRKKRSSLLSRTRSARLVPTQQIVCAIRIKLVMDLVCFRPPTFRFLTFKKIIIIKVTLYFTECQEIELEFGKWSDSQSIVAVTLSIIGLLTTTFTAFVFGCHNDTPVVKASTRELTYMILVGMALCYLTTFPLLAPPTKASCTLSRILPGFSFSLIFAALLTKTNRIARILAGSKKRICTRRSRWLSLTAQVGFAY